jgi:hypothetical protein
VRAASSAGRVPGRVPAHQRLDDRQPRLRGDDDPPAGAVRHHQRGRGAPAAQRLLGDAQVRPGEQRPRVEQQRRAVPGLGDRLGPRASRRRARAGADPGQHRRPAAGGPHRSCRGTPGPAPRRCARRRPLRPAAAATRRPGSGRRCPGARTSGSAAAPPPRPAPAGRAGAQSQRSGAVPAPRRLAARPAGQERDVAAAGHLHEHRPARLQRRAGGGERDVRHAGGAGVGVAGQLGPAVAGRDDPRHGRPHGRPVGDDLPRPARLHEQLASAVRAYPPTSSAGPGGVRAQHQHVADVRVGRARLGVAVVAVVPHREQAGVGDRGERGGARADDHADLPAAHGQPAPVPLGRAEVGRQRDHPVRPDARRARRPEGVEVALVGHDEQRPAPGARRGGGGVGQPGRPVLAGQRLPDGVRGPAAGQGVEQGGAPGVARPAGRGLDGPGHGVPGPRRLRLDPRVPRRHREPHDVGEHPGVPVGDGPAQRGHLGGERRFGGDDLLDPGERAAVVGPGGPLQQEAVDQPPGEPHPHPYPGLRVGVEVPGHAVVEGPVEVCERDVDGDARDGPVGGGGPLPPPPHPARRHGRMVPDDPDRTTGARAQARSPRVRRSAARRPRRAGVPPARAAPAGGCPVRSPRPTSAPRRGRCAPTAG